MRMITLTLLIALLLVHPHCRAEVPDATKCRLLAAAEAYGGQRDPAGEHQRELETILADLLKASPQPPVADRLHLLQGAWKQVFGPLDYRSDASRDIDPELGIDEIYQVVLPDGVYYNVSPLYPDGDRSRERTGFLRGRYRLNGSDPNRLDVAFTSYRGIEGRPKGETPLYALAAQAEAGGITDEITIVPWIIVQLFFGSGALEELYTDETLRVVYGSNGAVEAKRSLYVMERMPAERMIGDDNGCRDRH